MINALSNATSTPTHAPELREQATQRGQPKTSTPQQPPDHDVVELSEAAQQRIDAGSDKPIREQLVARIRAEIAAGTYLTPDKIEKTVERLHREIFGR